MKKVYLINDVALFIPDECCLAPRKSWPTGRVTLHAPASECLLLLLTNNGQPVTQKAFFSQVWEKKGAVVSTNTLYQSIASVRKALKATGLEEDIIRTIPKQGFQCNASVSTRSLTEFTSRPQIIPSLPPTTEVPTPTQENAPARVKKQKGLLLSVLISIAMVAAVLGWKSSLDTSLPPVYYPAGSIQNCTLFSSWSGTQYSQAIFNDLRLRHPIDCAKKTTAYITVNRLQMGTTLILCDVAIERNNAQCHSIMFQDENNEDK